MVDCDRLDAEYYLKEHIEEKHKPYIIKYLSSINAFPFSLSIIAALSSFAFYERKGLFIEISTTVTFDLIGFILLAGISYGFNKMNLKRVVAAMLNYLLLSLILNLTLFLVVFPLMK
jgi:uncharacterized membrane protein